jgi:hypothetical protein
MAYVPFGSQCDLPNSQTPMSQDAINAQNRRVARVGRRFVAGNVALDRLVTRLGGIGIGTVPGAMPLASPAAFVNAPSCDAPIGGGSNAGLYGRRTDQYKYGVSMGGSAIVAAPVAGTGASGQVITDDVVPGSNGSAAAGSNGNGSAAAAPGSAAQPTVGQPNVGTPGNPWPGPNWWVPSRRFAGRSHCQVPQILPLQTVFAANPNPTPITVLGPGPAAAPVPVMPATPAAPSAPPVAGAPVGPPTFPTTGNPCLDAALGYVIPSQLDPGQQLICAMAGYGMLGERPGPLLTQAMVAWRNANPSLLPKVPLQSNVPPASMSMLPTAASSVLGVAGLTDAAAPSWQGLAVVITLGAALGFLYARFGQKGRF